MKGWAIFESSFDLYDYVHLLINVHLKIIVLSGLDSISTRFVRSMNKTNFCSIIVLYDGMDGIVRLTLIVSRAYSSGNKNFSKLISGSLNLLTVFNLKICKTNVGKIFP